MKAFTCVVVYLHDQGDEKNKAKVECDLFYQLADSKEDAIALTTKAFEAREGHRLDITGWTVEASEIPADVQKAIRLLPSSRKTVEDMQRKIFGGRKI